MKRIFLSFLLFSAAALHAEEEVTHAALVGSWVFFYISKDSFDSSKPVVTEQRLIFLDGQNVSLNIAVRDNEYIQQTSYILKYALSIRDNKPYLTLFSAESSEVLGAYVRMPMKNGMELSARPGFNYNTQLYRRNSISLPGQFNPAPFKNDTYLQVPPRPAR